MMLGHNLRDVKRVRETLTTILWPPPQKGGLHGLYIMAIFLACGFLISLGWGGITVILMSVARVGFNSLP
jgi:hypothetical protein